MTFNPAMHPKATFTALLLIMATASHAQDPTYYKDIAPIVLSNCAPCHQPGEAAPFSLLTYEDVAKRASFIKKVVNSHYMPPWRADGSYRHFSNERGLSDAQIALLSKWIDNNAPAGKPADAPPAPHNLVRGTLYGRKPDLVLTAADSFHLPGDNGEDRKSVV